MKAEDYAQAAKQDTRSICCGCWAVVLGMLLYGVGIYGEQTGCSSLLTVVKVYLQN